MPRNYVRFKGNQMKWKRHVDRDSEDFVRSNNLHIRREADGGRSGYGRRSFPQNGGVDMLKRAVAMNLLPAGPSGTSTSSNDTGLGPGEAWARITIIYGTNYVLGLLQELVNTAFGTQLRFYNACAEGRNTVMYAKIRQKQLTVYRKALQTLKDPNDTTKTLVADITLVPEPRVPPANSNGVAGHLPDSWMEALKQCFLERYQAANRSLDLSNLHTDPGLLSKGLYLPLNRPAVVYSMISILNENSAQLVTLNLSNNRMPHMNYFSPLAGKINGNSVVVERIDLSGNPLSGIPSLAGLRGIAGLVELDISDTALLNRMKQNFRFLAAKLVKFLPGVKRLNGEDLPKAVLFAVERGDSSQPDTSDHIPLPSSSLGHFPNDDVKVSLLYFLKEYFTHFDSSPRSENILPHYTTGSRLVISVSPETRSVCAPQLVLPNRPDGAGDSVATNTKTYLLTSKLFGGHLQLSRNLLRCRDDSRRRDLVIRGSIAIAATLDKLPPTEHPLGSLSVDVAFASPSQMVFTVTGVFFELSDRNPSIANDYSRHAGSTSASRDGRTVYKTLRSFTRTMIVVAPNGHILHDDFIITNPSKLLIKKYIDDVVKENVGLKQMETTESSSSTAGQPVQSDVKQSLVDQLRQRTGLNQNFARQCLEEYNWDFPAAASAFDALNISGSIPPEAFA